MRKIKFADTGNPTQPALIVTYGTAGRKYRPLDRLVLVVGKARGCDIGLAAPDVSNVHCLIVRTPGGYYVRDCASRSGTRLNGDPVTEALLRDGDILQIGPFSFRAFLPSLMPLSRNSLMTPEQIRKLERSRANLARLALTMRRCLRETASQ